MMKFALMLWILVFSAYSWAETLSISKQYANVVITRCEKEAGRSTMIDFAINKNWTKNLNECLELQFLGLVRKYRNNSIKIMTAGAEICDKYFPPGEEMSLSLASSIERDWLKKTPNLEKTLTTKILKQHIEFYAEKALMTQKILRKIK